MTQQASHSQGWLAHACVPRCGCYGRAVAHQVAAGRGVNKFWGDVAPASAVAVQATA